MTTTEFFFILFAIITLVSGFRVVTTKLMFHAALYLVISLFGVALMFVLMEAGFLAAVQLIVYIGAIAILIIFAVMLTRGIMESKALLNSQSGLAAVVSGAALFILIRVVTGFNFQTVAADVPADNVAQLGHAIVGQFVLPFEVASVLLLAALIGAIYIARERKKGE